MIGIYVKLFNKKTKDIKEVHIEGISVGVYNGYIYNPYETIKCRAFSKLYDMNFELDMEDVCENTPFKIIEAMNKHLSAALDEDIKITSLQIGLRRGVDFEEDEESENI